MKNKGFTLIEIVVVIAIIAVMAGIFTVNMSNILQSVNKSEEERLLSDLELAADAYINANKIDFSSCYTVYISDLESEGYLKVTSETNYPSSVIACKDANGVLKFTKGS